MAIDRTPFEATVETMAHDGRGVARVNGKTVFIDDALPGELVTAIRVKKRRDFDEARLESVLRASQDRVEPGCLHFGVCGGCTLQHLSINSQLVHKKTVLAENFRRIGKVEPENWLGSLDANQWGYRRRARLGVKYVNKKQRVLVGFRERRKPYIADIASCKVLHPKVGDRLPLLADLIESLSIRKRIPQIEVAVADNVTALVFRVLDPPSNDDLKRMTEFSARHNLRFYLQSGGPESITQLEGTVEALSYRVNPANIQLEFGPSDFIQVNAEINNSIIERVRRYLELTCDDRLLDLFCGLGNFSLSLADMAGEVVGIEGDASLIDRARKNAKLNSLKNASFHVADLFEGFNDFSWAQQAYSAIVLDPPRAGAELVCQNIERFKASRIIYVSCHPATLARDAGILVKEKGYTLTSAGVMDMFPHTSHVESMAIFNR